MIQWNFREDLQQRALSSSGGHQALRPYALIGIRAQYWWCHRCY